jgi:uncharacterized membrane protein (DUF4010 family)
MDPEIAELFQRLGIAVLLGMLVGLQRQHVAAAMAGLRTFPLITALGTLAALLDQHYGGSGWIVGAGFLAVVAVVVTAAIHVMRHREADFGITTEMAILIMYAVGAYLAHGNLLVAIAVGAGVAVLLQFKPELHSAAAKLGDADLRAIMQFALITGIILPLLPNRPILENLVNSQVSLQPLLVLNLFETWLMVVLIVGIGLAGYITYKFFGHGAGTLLGGLLGGAISSTATSVSYARRTALNPALARIASVIIVLAVSVMFVRMLIEVAVVAPGFVPTAWPPLLIIMAATAGSAMLVWMRVRLEPGTMPEQENPSELRPALIFAGIYVGVKLALAATRQFLPPQWLYAIAAVSGLADMDAITLSTSRLVQLGPQHGGIAAEMGWRIIVVAAISNLIFKSLIIGAIGSKRLMFRVGLMFVLPLATAIALLVLWKP